MSGIRTAVVTGGHTFDVIRFHHLFRELGGIDAYIQHMEDFVAAPEAVRDGYDVIVLFTHLKGADSDQPPPDRVQPVFDHLGAMAQGIVVLHHGLLAYPGWPILDAITGLTVRTLDRYSHDETIPVHVADSHHPITAGLTDWEMIDETYRMPDAPAENHILLTTDHPDSLKTLAWVRQHGQSRVFCLQSGHDNQTWTDPNFRRVLRQGIVWCAGH
jgi:trehalose utilization protein